MLSPLTSREGRCSMDTENPVNGAHQATVYPLGNEMNQELKDLDFQRFWRRLQQLGLNAYEARSYLVLVGHPRFKALELAARAHVPRQKIYEVLDSLVEKG